MRLHVAGLPREEHVRIADVAGVFDEYDPVMIIVAQNKDTKLCRGFAFIELSEEDGEKAIADFKANPKVWREGERRRLEVTIAKPPEERERERQERGFDRRPPRGR
jgi:hypothetical protein